LTLLVYLTLILSAAVAIASAENKNGRSEKNSANSEARAFEVDVHNFGKVTDFFYRGAQPKDNNYFQLAALGVKTIIDLRNDPKDYAKEMTERHGMKYINLPMSDKDYPAADTAPKFLTLINNQENWPVYVHCAGGRHRTGVMTAVYRMSVQGWDVNRAYAEMKDYDFYTRWGHKAMKDFIFDYYRELAGKRADNNPIPTN
jgi:protein tyrosine/serine phosphatase